jgi:hypothetical protein
VGLRQEEWDRVHRVGYIESREFDEKYGNYSTTIFAYFLKNMLISVYFNL